MTSGSSAGVSTIARTWGPAAFVATAAIVALVSARPQNDDKPPIPEEPPKAAPTAPVPDQRMERRPGNAEPAPVPAAGVPTDVPLMVDALPDDLPKRVAGVVDRLRKCERDFRVHWRTPREFRITIDHARRLVAEFEQIDAQCTEAEQEYRNAHMAFANATIDAGHGVRVTNGIDATTERLQRDGLYDPERDYLTFGVRFEKGTFYVLSRRGSIPAIDALRDYSDSMVLVYPEVCGGLLRYLTF